MPHLQSLDYLMLGGYMVLMACVGSFFGWFVKDSASYLKGGNTIPWVVSSVSNFMSMFSTFVFVAYAGIAYEHGLVAVTVFWSTILPCLIAGKWLAARWRRAELTTPVEYLERRFNLGVRQLFSWTGLVMRFLDNAVRLYATGIFLATVTPLSLPQAILISGLFITIFTMIGGLWAVTVMDTIQCIVLFGATLILVPLSLQAAGGLPGIAEAQPTHLTFFHGEKGAPLWLLAYYVMIIFKYNGNWAFIQRLYAVKDEVAAKKVGYFSAFLFFVSPLIFLLPAVAARVIVPELEDPEQSYVAVCVKLLPAGMMGLMIASMFSATMSSLNSEFNVMAAVLTNDVFRRFVCPDSSETRLVWVARFATIGVGLLITFGALFVGGFGGAFEANKLFTSILAIPLAVPLVLGLIWKRPTTQAVVVTVLGGAGVSLVLNSAGWFSWELSTLISIAVCLLIVTVGSRPRARTPYRQTEVDAFFAQVESPLPADRVPRIDARFGVAVGRLFSLSFLVSGFFFAVVSGMNIGEMSGKLGMLTSVVCVAAAVILWRYQARDVAKIDPGT